MLVTPGLESLLNNEVAIGVIGNHDILVARRTCFAGEGAGIVCVELADGEDPDEDLIGRGGGGDWWRQGDGGLGLGRTDVLALLGG